MIHTYGIIYECHILLPNTICSTYMIVIYECHILFPNTICRAYMIVIYEPSICVPHTSSHTWCHILSFIRGQAINLVSIYIYTIYTR